MGKNIDFSKSVNEDDIIQIEEKLQGVTVLLDGLLFAEVGGAGSHDYQKTSYQALNIVLDSALADLATIKNGIEYMSTKIKE